MNVIRLKDTSNLNIYVLFICCASLFQVNLRVSQIEQKTIVKDPGTTNDLAVSGASSVTLNTLKDQPVSISMTHQDSPVFGLAVHGQYVFVVHERDDVIYLYNQTGLLNSAQVAGLKYPSGMAVIPQPDNLQVVITDNWRPYSLHWVSVSIGPVEPDNVCAFTVRSRRQKLDYSPWSVFVDGSCDQMLVTNPGHHSIHVYDHSGKDNGSVSVPLDIKPDSVIPLTAGAGYVVIAGINKQLVWLSANGGVTKRIKANDPGTNFFLPHHLTRDKEGRIILADQAGHSVLLLTEEGQHICHLLKKQHGLHGPRQVALTAEDDKLWVAHGSKKGCYELLCIHYQAFVKAARPVSPFSNLKSDETPDNNGVDTAFKRIVHNVDIKLVLPKLVQTELEG